MTIPEFFQAVDFEAVWPVFWEQTDERNKVNIERDHLIERFKESAYTAWKDIIRTEPSLDRERLRLGVTRRVESHDGERCYYFDVQGWSVSDHHTYGFYAPNWAEFCSYELMQASMDRYGAECVAGALLHEMTGHGFTADAADEARERLRESLKQSEEDIKAGRVYSTEEVFQHIDERLGFPPTSVRLISLQNGVSTIPLRRRNGLKRTGTLWRWMRRRSSGLRLTIKPGRNRRTDNRYASHRETNDV